MISPTQKVKAPVCSYKWDTNYRECYTITPSLNQN